jgi:hypothetical protein
MAMLRFRFCIGAQGIRAKRRASRDAINSNGAAALVGQGGGN